MRVLILNPLEGALAHYTKALRETLVDLGCTVDVEQVAEPSLSGRGRIRWLASYASRSWRRSRVRYDLVVATWPSAGYWDVLVLSALSSRGDAAVVMHDPQPLVRAVGYGRLARRAAMHPLLRTSVIVHSDAASEALGDFRSSRVISLPHPVLKPTAAAHAPEQTTIRVLGQYKSSRDIRVLSLVRDGGSESWRYEIVGRGWPRVDGWDVHAGFLSEAEFDAAVDTSSAVLIPYRRFFQSGVALRSLERCVPIVGPAASSLATLPAPVHHWLARGDDDWPRAVQAAISAPQHLVETVALDVHSAAVDAWREWVQTVT